MTERDLNKKPADVSSAILGFIADPVVVMASSGHILDSNQMVEQIINVKAENFIMDSKKEVKGGLEISFADTDIGISDEISPKLFSPIFTTKAQGMGFGLATCKRIIEAQGGAISVKTVNGQGTTFTITLPVDEIKMEVKTYG
jgi:signal transduction histidine kinase